MTDTNTANPVDVDTVATLLVALDTEAFRGVVDDDLRSALPEEMVGALRSPLAVQRWYDTLMMMSLSVEGQLAAKTAENNSKVQRLYSQRQAHLAQDEQSNFEQWKAKSLRFKTGLDMKLFEARGLLRSRAEATILAHVTSERNMAFNRISVLEAAIGRHRDRFCGDDTNFEEVEQEDQDLWGLVPRKPDHFELKLGDF